MKKDIALQLADAIMSGHYTRGGNVNRTVDNKFCIGGVLINLFAMAHPHLAAKETDPLMFLGTNTALPKAVREWADIKCSNMATRNGVAIKFGNTKHTPSYGLQHANDSKTETGDYRYSWAELAQWLRKEGNPALI